MSAATAIVHACIVALLIWLLAALVVIGALYSPTLLKLLGTLTFSVAVFFFARAWLRPDPRPGYHPRYERNDERLPL